VLLLLLLCAFSLRAESDANIPEALQPWREKAYTRRFFLRVDAPGEAGATGLQNDPLAASVVLPLKFITASDRQEKPEDVLLVGEDGVIHPVLARKISGGTEAEIAFATKSGLRRFCLYAGAAENPPAYSPTTFQTQALRVKVRGRSIPGELTWQENRPLTLDEFKKIAERGDGAFEPKLRSSIDDVECPWFQLGVDPSGHVNRKENPQRYGATYEAFLRTPLAGAYKFAIDTPGAAQLLINGKPVLGAEKPDDTRAPFALNGVIELPEGVQRVTLYYAEANARFDKTNADLARFGIRLHWQPPFATELLCIPAQAFPRALPAVVSKYEVLDAAAQPFIHVEIVGHVRAGAHLGEKQAREWVLVAARATGVAEGARLVFSGAVAQAPAQAAPGDALRRAAWMPVDREVRLHLASADGKELATRQFKAPAKADGARDVMDLEAELSVKSAPEFLYPEENAHFHLESVLSPAPVIIPKERRENNMLPPPPRPMGEFSLRWWLATTEDALVEGTKVEQVPLGRVEVPRDKQRVSINAKELEKHSASGNVRLHIQLTAGGVPADGLTQRLLHSRAAKWPQALSAGAGSLLLESSPTTEPKKTETPSLLTQIEESRAGVERVLMIVPREDEADYRQFAPLKAMAERFAGKDALFIGDPLLEGAAKNPPGSEKNAAAKPTGLAARIISAYGNHAWQCVPLPGPHRQLPIYRLIAALDDFIRKAKDGRVPETVVLSLGGGDAARQTPPHSFERGLDVAIDRLRQAGAQRIIVIGVIPEPFREKQGEVYQERLHALLRQHHVESIDVFHAWTKESDWARRFSLEGGNDAVYGATPNSAAMDDIVRLLKDKL